MAQWDYFNPNDRNCQEDYATKRYVESRFDTLVKTLQEKFDEYDTDIQSDWAETNATSLAFILNKSSLDASSATLKYLGEN